MNLILLLPDEVQADGLVELTGRRARHVFEVHRAQVGEQLVVGVLGGRIGRGEVLAVDPKALRLRVTLTEPSPALPGVDLLLAMPRPKILRKVLQAAASVGVGRIVLLNSFRVEKSYFDSPLLAADAIQEQLVLGLEQGRHTTLPEVLLRKRFKPFVEDELDALWPPEAATRLVAHPGATAGLEGCQLPPKPGRVVVAIGPEGGWIPYEVERLEERGFQRFSLGEFILRVDVAVPYVLGQVALRKAVDGRWSMVDG